VEPLYQHKDRLCDLVVTVCGYSSKDPGFDSGRHQIFWEVADLERGPLSLVSKTEEIFGRNSSDSGLESRERIRTWGSFALTTRQPLFAKLALTSPTSGGRSVGIVRSRTQTMEFSLVLVLLTVYMNVASPMVTDRTVIVCCTFLICIFLMKFVADRIYMIYEPQDKKMENKA
jgi:hypothetical protein